MKIATIQSALFWEDTETNLHHFNHFFASLDAPVDIIVLPEMFTTGFSMDAQKIATSENDLGVKWMIEKAIEKDACIVGSIAIKEHNKFYNRLFWVMPDGSIHTYNKRHLFAYANEDKHYTAGTKRLIASVNGWKINLQVCYDLRFPVWARQQTRTISTSLDSANTSFDSAQDSAPEFDVLIYVANWPERRVHAWKTLLTARAIENQCYVIGVNRTGDDGNQVYHSGSSMVIDAMGEVLYEKEHEEDIHTITLSKEKLEEIRHKLPFLKDGDAFSILP